MSKPLLRCKKRLSDRNLCVYHCTRSHGGPKKDKKPVINDLIRQLFFQMSTAHEGIFACISIRYPNDNVNIQT